MTKEITVFAYDIDDSQIDNTRVPVNHGGIMRFGSVVSDTRHTRAGTSTTTL